MDSFSVLKLDNFSSVLTTTAGAAVARAELRLPCLGSASTYTGNLGGLVVTRPSSATLIEIDQICENAIASFSVLEEPVIVLRALSQALDVETAKKSLLGWLRLGLKSLGLGEHAQVLVVVLLLLDNVDRTVLIWQPNGIRLLDIQHLRT